MGIRKTDTLFHSNSYYKFLAYVRSLMFNLKNEYPLELYRWQFVCRQTVHRLYTYEYSARTFFYYTYKITNVATVL